MSQRNLHRRLRRAGVWLAGLLFAVLLAPAFAAVPAPATAAAKPSPGSLPASTDIRDIRGPIHLPERWPWVLGSVAALLGGGALYLLLRRRRKAKSVPLAPHELALARLELARFLLQDERPIPFFFTLAEALREYLEGRFAIPAGSMTTEELGQVLSLPDSPLNREEDLLTMTLNTCDLAKFARRAMGALQMEEQLERVRSFVLRTRPDCEPVTAAGSVLAQAGGAS